MHRTSRLGVLIAVMPLDAPACRGAHGCSRPDPRLRLRRPVEHGRGSDPRLRYPSACARPDAPPANVLFWGPTTDAPKRWTPIEAPTEIQDSMFRSGFGPELSAAHRLKDLHPGKQIGIFKFAKGSTSLYRAWDPDNPIGLYDGCTAACSTHAVSSRSRRSGHVHRRVLLDAGRVGRVSLSSRHCVRRQPPRVHFALRYRPEAPHAARRRRTDRRPEDHLALAQVHPRRPSRTVRSGRRRPSDMARLHRRPAA